MLVLKRSLINASQTLSVMWHAIDPSRARMLRAMINRTIPLHLQAVWWSRQPFPLRTSETHKDKHRKISWKSSTVCVSSKDKQLIDALYFAWLLNDSPLTIVSSLWGKTLNMGMEENAQVQFPFHVNHHAVFPHRFPRLSWNLDGLPRGRLKKALQKNLLPSWMEQKCSVRFFS